MRRTISVGNMAAYRNRRKGSFRLCLLLHYIPTGTNFRLFVKTRSYSVIASTKEVNAFLTSLCCFLPLPPPPPPKNIEVTRQASSFSSSLFLIVPTTASLINETASSSVYENCSSIVVLFLFASSKAIFYW